MKRWWIAVVLALSVTGAHAIDGTCRTCPDYDFGPFTPTRDWQTHSAQTSGADDCAWYAFTLVAGQQYEFKTCTPGRAFFDTILYMNSPSCALLAQDDDSCDAPPASRILYTPVTTGTHRLRVAGVWGSTGSYTLAYRRATTCVSAITLAPSLVTTDPASCSRTVTFDVAGAASATLPVTWTWTVIPPFGSFAVPRSGTVTSSAPGGAAQFTSRLTGLGDFSVGLQATNACGSVSAAKTITLADATRPTLTPPPSRSVDCAAVPPPEPARVRDNCDRAPVVSMSETVTPGSCPGRRTIRRTFLATDASGNVSAPGVQVLTAVDARAPVIRADATVRQCAYPPDHGVACFVPADFAPSVTEACSLPVSVRFARITSSEAPGCDGAADLEPDIGIAADGLSACIRAERCNALAGRAYLVEAIAIDACGNASAPAAIGTILIPPDGTDTSSCRVPAPGDP